LWYYYYILILFLLYSSILIIFLFYSYYILIILIIVLLYSYSIILILIFLFSYDFLLIYFSVIVSQINLGQDIKFEYLPTSILIEVSSNSTKLAELFKLFESIEGIIVLLIVNNKILDIRY
jgi:hypothetical protein